MTSSKSYREWGKRIESGTFTKAQCSAWCNRVQRAADDQCFAASSLTVEEANDLIARLRSVGGVRIESDHAEQGMMWALKKPQCKVFPPEYVHACRMGYVDYRFMGAHLAHETQWRRTYVPAYRADWPARPGDQVIGFTYAYVGWRTGVGGADGLDIFGRRYAKGVV